MKGKILLKPLQKIPRIYIVEGMTVIFNYSIQVIDSISNSQIFLKDFDHEDWFEVGDLKVIVIEYEHEHPHAGVSKKGTGPGVGKRLLTTELLPLHLDEWEYVMSKGLLNSNVEFASFDTFGRLVHKVNEVDPFGDMRKLGLSSDQCGEVSDYIERLFISKTKHLSMLNKAFEEGRIEAPYLSTAYKYPTFDDWYKKEN